MEIRNQIQHYLASLPAVRQSEMRTLYQFVNGILPEGRLWFLDGKDDSGKILTNPNIGFGKLTLRYKDGSKRDFYQIGISSTSSGLSVYLMGLKNRDYLPQTFSKTIGKAAVSGYCIKFRKMEDIHLTVLEEAIRYGLGQSEE